MVHHQPLRDDLPGHRPAAPRRRRAQGDPILQKTLKPGARIVSHRFEMGDWQPDETKTITAKNNNGLPESYRLHIWTIK